MKLSPHSAALSGAIETDRFLDALLNPGGRPVQPKPIAAAADKVPNVATAEGRQIGAKLAKFCDDAEPQARLRMPDLPPRCSSCAFRAGPHVANGSPETQMDALKCVMEGVEFQCHQHNRRGQPCSGWLMMILAREESGFMTVPWPFSDEPEPNDAAEKPASYTCPLCGADKPRACASTTANGESIHNCMWMPEPLTAFEAERHRKFWAERNEELRDDIRMRG